jgi:predicted GNAT family acetyltransferase
MTVVHHEDARTFVVVVEPLLARNTAVRAFVTALVEGWDRRPPGSDERKLLATCVDHATVALGLQRDGPLVVANSDAPAVVRIADDLTRRDDVVLPGVVGEAAPCEAFADRWCRHTGQGHRVGMHMRHHELTRVAPFPVAPGHVRRATDDDLPWLSLGAMAFAAEAELPEKPEQVRRRTARSLAERRIRIWEDGAPVAFASGFRAGDDAARINLVYTLPEHRGRGYATSLTAAVSRELMDEGARRVFLMTDVANPTSNAIYARVGYRPVSDEYRYDFVASAP